MLGTFSSHVLGCFKINYLTTWGNGYQESLTNWNSLEANKQINHVLYCTLLQLVLPQHYIHIIIIITIIIKI